MQIAIDTHTHTLVSGHAYNTMKEMAKAAAEKGLKGLAITEHAPMMPGTCHEYYFSNLKVVPRTMYGIELLLGVELNVLDESGKVDLSDSLISDMDLVIASLHIPCYKGEKTREHITNAYVNVMERGDIDIIGHPDDSRFPIDYERLVKTAARTHTILEVNHTSLKPDAYRVNARENYHQMLTLCKEYGVMVALGTDAHVDALVGEYPYAYRLLEEENFPEKLVANTSVEKLKSLLPQKH